MRLNSYGKLRLDLLTQGRREEKVCPLCHTSSSGMERKETTRGNNVHRNVYSRVGLSLVGYLSDFCKAVIVVVLSSIHRLLISLTQYLLIKVVIVELCSPLNAKFVLDIYN